MTISVPADLVFIDQGDGVTTEFSYPVKFLEASELVVFSREDGVDTTLVLNTHYTVAGAGVDGGGTITMLYVPSAAEEIGRYRSTGAKQIVDLVDGARNPAQAVEKQLDRLAMVGQDSAERMARAVKVAPGAGPLKNIPMPEAGMPLLGNDGEDGFVWGGETYEGLRARVNATESHNTTQDGRLDSIESLNTTQNNRLDAVEPLADRAWKAPSGSGGSITAGNEGQVARFDADGNLEGTSALTGSGDMLESAYDPNGIGLDVFDSANHEFKSTAANAVSRTVRGKGMDIPFVEDWGALGDGSNDDLAAFQKALDEESQVFIRARNYILDGSLTFKNMGGGFRAFGHGNSDTSSLGNAPKLLFMGTGASCIEQADPGEFTRNNHFEGFVIRALGQYDQIIKLRSPVAVWLKDVKIETDKLDTAGLYTDKIDPSDPAWENILSSFRVRLPDASTAYTANVMWSDSEIVTSHFTGGMGYFSRGNNNVCVASQFERSQGAGYTVKKLPGIGRSDNLVGCVFDANAQYGVLVDVDDDTDTSASLRMVGTTITGCRFRTQSPTDGTAGIADIGFANNTGQVYRGVTGVANRHTVRSDVLPWEYDAAAWTDIQMVAPILYDSTVPAFTPDSDNHFYAGPQGVYVPNGEVLVRGSRTVRGQANVAGYFGPKTTGGGIALGVLNGNLPFIGATQDASGTWQDLRFRTHGAFRMILGETALVPATPGGISCGSQSFPWNVTFSQRLTLDDGITEPFAVSGKAHIYVDSADGDLKVKFGDGTVKTIVTDT